MKGKDTKVELIISKSPEGFERAIEEFCIGREIIDVKFNSTVNTYDGTRLFALVIYKEEKK